jgi:hypothetical protein
LEFGFGIGFGIGIRNVISARVIKCIRCWYKIEKNFIEMWNFDAPERIKLNIN